MSKLIRFLLLDYFYKEFLNRVDRRILRFAIYSLPTLFLWCKGMRLFANSLSNGL
jgi:hypothetical protein